MSRLISLALVGLCLLPLRGVAVEPAPQPRLIAEPDTVPNDFLRPFNWRCIGPANMGGRVTALAVVPSDPTTFYVGTATGGLLKTVNSGITFQYLFDQEATVSIGDVAVSVTDPNIVWVGTGEANPRNSVSYGDGVYRSQDGGKTWRNMGLKNTFQIGKILIHPTKPNIVYVGAMGRLYGPHEERGLFKTEDGGETWRKILYVNDQTGVTDMRMDPDDPDTLIVAMWDHRRDEFDRFFQKPSPAPDVYGPIVTHGPGGGLFKTTDAGITWKRLNDERRKSGLPSVKTGRIGLDYSTVTKGKLIAVIDSENYGKGTVSPTYLGVVLNDDPGKVTIQSVSKGSPAEKGQLKPQDRLLTCDGVKITGADQFVDLFLAKQPGDKIQVAVGRGQATVTLSITLGKQEKKEESLPPVFGFTIGPKLTLSRIAPNGGAANAGLLPGDILLSLDGVVLKEYAGFTAFVSKKKPGDVVKVEINRADEKRIVEVKLAPNPRAGEVEKNFRDAPDNRPYGASLGGQMPNVQNRQGPKGYQTGGVYISKDNGETWERVNSYNPRPMYFSVVRFDPANDNNIYVAGVKLAFSTDGGKTFRTGRDRGVHADHHALWINPHDSRHMIIGCDGGVYFTHDRGENWDHLNTLSLGQFYHVTTDNRRPYRVYGGLQDNGSWGGPSDTLRNGSGPTNADWIFLRGGDGFVCRVDPTDPDLVYSESQNGAISRRNLRTNESVNIAPRRGPKGEALRFNWFTPMILSHHNSSIFYCGAQFVFRSISKGSNPLAVSPELTRTKYGTITVVQESPLDPNVLWAGTDDGFVWVTKDGGQNWVNVYQNLESAGVPGPRWVASLEPSRAGNKPGRCYVTLDAHRSNDDKPYVYVTEDYGATWKPLTANLPEFGSSRVLREDIVNQNVLYLGTEFGAWVSVNRGKSWNRLGSGLPTVPVFEFAQPTVADELVAGTHGRSVWILDIATIRQYASSVWNAEATLFAPVPAVHWLLGVGGESPYKSSDRKFVGRNPVRGAMIDYALTKPAKSASLKILNIRNTTLREFRSVPTTVGTHRVAWDLRSVPTQPSTDRGRVPRRLVPPGTYRIVLTVDGKEYTKPLTVENDPNAPKDFVLTEQEETEDEEEEREKQELGMKKEY